MKIFEIIRKFWNYKKILKFWKNLVKKISFWKSRQKYWWDLKDGFFHQQDNVLVNKRRGWAASISPHCTQWSTARHKNRRWRCWRKVSFTRKFFQIGGKLIYSALFAYIETAGLSTHVNSIPSQSYFTPEEKACKISNRYVAFK